MSLQLDPKLLTTRHNKSNSELPVVVNETRHKSPAQQKRETVLGAVAGLTLAMLIVAAWQHAAPEGWRLSQLIGAFWGDSEATKIAASLEAEKARTAALLEEQQRMQQELILTQARAQEIVAAAQSQAQQEIQAMQGRVQIAATAYQTLFERSNKLALIYAQTAQGFVQMRTELARANQGGSTFVANAADIFKGLAMLSGRADMYAQADAIKRQTTESQMRELDAAMSRTVPTLDAQAFIAQGLPDPAQLAAALNFTPQAQRPQPIEIGDRPAMPVNPYRQTAPEN